MIPHTRIRPLVASRYQLLVKENHVVTPCLPPLKQVGQIGVDVAHIGAACGLRIAALGKPSAHSARPHAHALSNRGVTHSKCAQRDDLLISGETLFPVRLLQMLNFRRTSRRSGSLLDGLVVFRQNWSVSLTLCRQMACDAPFNRFP
jgi:hypothetical protein